MATGKIRVELPDGSIATRTTARTYTHILASSDPQGANWKVDSWCGSAELAAKAERSLRSTIKRYGHMGEYGKIQIIRIQEANDERSRSDHIDRPAPSRERGLDLEADPMIEKIPRWDLTSAECVCGNRPDLEGFYPCDRAGVPQDPTPEWGGDVYCDRCGRIIDADGLVVGSIRGEILPQIAEIDEKTLQAIAESGIGSAISELAQEAAKFYRRKR